MAKKTLYNGAYVRVNVDSPFGKNVTPRDWYDVAKDLEHDIKRHCDGIDSSSVEFDTDDVCEFCGYDWTEGDSPHNGCCDDDDTQVLEKANKAT